MRVMNTYDIEQAVERFYDHPVLGPATRTLANLEAAADANSDGWHTWPKPARAANKLMEMIERDGTYKYHDGDREDATVAEYRKALGPIKTFRTKTGIDFQIESV